MEIINRRLSSDGSVKYVFKNEKEYRFETIYFLFQGLKYGEYVETPTLCISSQAGCAMKCTFCATGKGGFFSNLSTREMQAQVELVQKDLETLGKPKATGIAMMGMGEPLMNYSQVLNFHDVMKESYNISISTVGIVPSIEKLAGKEDLRLRLYISIHSPYEEERSKIIPINNKYPLSTLIPACENYAKKKGKVIASYLLLKGVNDTLQHAEDLAQMLNPNYFETQILLFNAVEGIHFQRPQDDTAHQFAEVLKKRGLVSQVIISKGRDIGGGCGQLVQNS
ncbi:MAG: 23S rRNA (adenine(2503)-C(2))-methyltransferase RlmN [Waddliaceae bacterium]